MSNSYPIFTDFMKDIENYLDSRFTGVPKHELQEISAYIANRTIVLTNDVLQDSYRVTKNEATRRLRERYANIQKEVNDGQS